MSSEHLWNCEKCWGHIDHWRRNWPNLSSKLNHTIAISDPSLRPFASSWHRARQNPAASDSGPERSPSRSSLWFTWFLWFVLFFSLVWSVNQINQIDQTNQIDQPNHPPRLAISQPNRPDKPNKPDEPASRSLDSPPELLRRYVPRHDLSRNTA